MKYGFKIQAIFSKISKPGNIFETKCDFKIQAFFPKEGGR